MIGARQLEGKRSAAEWPIDTGDATGKRWRAHKRIRKERRRSKRGFMSRPGDLEEANMQHKHKNKQTGALTPQTHP